MVPVSVITPTHRGGLMLREAVASVLCQSHADFEMIVVADGCPDQLCDLEHLDPRLSVVRQTHRGISVARNVGLAHARSPFVAFLDHDDIMEERRLETQLSFLRARPDVAFCHTQFTWIAEDGNLLGPGNSWDVQYRDLIRGHLQILLPTVMARREVLAEVGGFDPLWDGLGDLDLACRVARDHLLGFIPQALTRYRKHPGNYSGHPLTSWVEIASLLRKHRRWAYQQRRFDLVADCTRGLRHNRRENGRGAYRSARAAWESGERTRALSYLALALGLDPLDALAEATLKVKRGRR